MRNRQFKYIKRMREEFAHRFPSGVAVSRETWEQLQEWHRKTEPATTSRESA